MMIKIDKDVPMPKVARRGIYPLKSMDVGDSFFAEGKNSQTICGSFAQHRPKKFVARSQIADGVSGVRVWRVE